MVIGALLGLWANPIAAQQRDPLAPLPEVPLRPALTIPALPPQATPPVAVHQGFPPMVLQTGQMAFASYKQALAARARREGIGEATIAATVPWLSLNVRVIALDRGQPGNIGNPNSTPPFAPYRREHVSADLIRRGRTVYAANFTRLAGIQARTGVEASVPIAIFGHETSYGIVTGGFDLLDALATLAYEGRRRELFESEFVAALR
ncbi:MAG: lytic murein transglycosylase, partial [Sphingomicrobium sp.]